MRNCFNCEHFVYKPELPFVGECHRYPPEIVSQPDQYAYKKIEDGENICAEYQRANKTDFP